MGTTGNPNTVHLEYSNNPNGEGKGKTPDKKVIVYTFKLIVNKKTRGLDGVVNLDGAGFTLFKITEPGGAESKVGEEKIGGHEFTWDRLDAGKYVLKETTVPAGYNKAADIEFTIESTYEADNLTGLVIKGSNRKEIGTSGDSGEKEMTFTVDLTAGSAQTDVMNEKGATLPETGGMGTTIFYVVGSVLVLAAAVLLVTKKRMNAD